MFNQDLKTQKKNHLGLLKIVCYTKCSLIQKNAESRLKLQRQIAIQCGQVCSHTSMFTYKHAKTHTFIISRSFLLSCYFVCSIISFCDFYSQNYLHQHTWHWPSKVRSINISLARFKYCTKTSDRFSLFKIGRKSPCMISVRH